MRQVVSLGVLQDIYEAARAILDRGEDVNALQGPLKALESMVRFRGSCAGQRVLNQARELYVDSACDIDIDDDTLVYHNDRDGHWVLAWCFVPDQEFEENGLPGGSPSVYIHAPKT